MNDFVIKLGQAAAHSYLEKIAVSAEAYGRAVAGAGVDRIMHAAEKDILPAWHPTRRKPLPPRSKIYKNIMDISNKTQSRGKDFAPQVARRRPTPPVSPPDVGTNKERIARIKAELHPGKRLTASKGQIPSLSQVRATGYKPTDHSADVKRVVTYSPK